MNNAAAQPARLVGDIGGSNTRLALFDATNNELRAVQVYANGDHACLEDIIERWLADLDDKAPETCCLAVAAPPFEDRVDMLNIEWSFSVRELTQRFGFAAMRCINDFEGNARALPHLRPADLHVLRTGDPGNCRKLATLGPGTGLGGATLEFCVDTPVANASEPGHMGLAPATAEEIELFRALLPRHGEVHAELLLSGAGLVRLYRTLAQVRGEPASDLEPAGVSAAGLSGESTLCADALKVFCALLGSACGDYVLTTGSYGGLYLAGGIVPRMVEFLAASDFADRFATKGDMASHMSKVPLFVITSGVAGMLGAAHTPL